MAKEPTKELNSLTSLLNKRKFLKGRVTQIANLVSRATDEELPFHANRLRELFARIEEVNMSVELLDEAEQEEGLQLESRCCDLLLALQRRVDEAASARAAAAEVADLVRTRTHSSAALLPKISLPTFSGNYDEWLSFKDIFESLVHNNSDLDDINKFYYLKSCLKGEAASLVSNIGHTAANYVKAWDVLMQRYNNKVLIVNKHIHTLMNLTKVSSAYTLRQLMNDFVQQFNSLLTLEVPNLCDMLLIHILSTKLDYSSLRDFELTRKCNDFPSINDFLQHIQHRCQALELVAPESAKPASTPQRSVLNVALSSNIQEKKGKLCDFCNGPHYVNRCFKFMKLTVNDRRKFVEKLKLCSLCLHTDHSVANCSHVFVCKICQQKHHTLLHQRDLPVNSNDLLVSSHEEGAEQLVDQQVVPAPAPYPRLADSPVVPQRTVNLYTAVEEKCEVSLLPTALCYVIDDSGEVHFCRILLDSGSQNNYITEKFVSKLNCKKTPVKLSVSGVGCKFTPIDSKINLNISSRDFKHKFNSEFCVLQTITESLPITSFPKHLIKCPGSVNLADPEFNVSRKIDAILGINSFRLCLKDGQLNLGSNVPGLLNTSFGWILCGNLVLSKKQLVKSDESVCNFLQNNLTCSNQELPSQQARSSGGAAREQLPAQSVPRAAAGRYEVGLPFKQKLLPMSGNSFNVTLCCPLSSENKLQSDPHCHTKSSCSCHNLVKQGQGHGVNDLSNKRKIKSKKRKSFRKSADNSFNVSFSGHSLNNIFNARPIIKTN